MTSAARPTWLPAMGGFTLRDTSAAPVRQISAKDLAAHTKLKTRGKGQNAPDELNDLDIKERLRDAERKYFEKKGLKMARDIEGEEETKEDKGEPSSVDDLECEGQEDGSNMISKILGQVDDADDTDSSENDDNDDSSEDESSSDDDDDNDTAQLLLELEKIKKERALEKEQKELRKMEEEECALEEEAMQANPLMNATAGGKVGVKRRWDDDVIFKYQAKGVDENPQKRFINDLIRSDFHRKFMNKYIK